MTRPEAQARHALALEKAGFNPFQIARMTGIPRTTIRGWIAYPPWDRTTRRSQCPRCDEAPLAVEAYAWLLGSYLGDGTITRQPRDVWRLRISQDQRYRDLIAECVRAMSAVMPNNVLVQQRIGCVEIGASSKHWPCLFPQAGPGPKHKRPIVLAGWQQAIANEHPKLLLRGLIHSDGCRHVNAVTTRGKRYEYLRYEFTNASEDILGIFTATCDLLGVHWTRTSPRNVAVSRQGDIAFLDTFIGPKS